MSHILAAFILSVAAAPLRAGTASFDTVYVSTIAGNADSNGIVISSSVYINDNGLFTEGVGGAITSASSITASAFFGDGSHLSRVAILSSTQAFSGANTFASSFTIQSNGRQIILSTGPLVNNLSISTTGVISFSPSLHNSSSTVVPYYQTSVSSFGPCVTGSTLTITTQGGAVEVSYAGNLANYGGNANPKYITFLQDGQFVRNLDSQIGVAVYFMDGSIYDAESFSYLLDNPAPSSGVHSYCLSVRGYGGTPTVVGDDGASSSRCTSIFYLKELK